MIDWVKTHWQQSYSSLALVAEPAAAEPILANLLGISDVHAFPDPPDLNVKQEWNRTYDVVVCQAVLEHVCRPSIAIENLLQMTSLGGLLSLHTHLPEMPYHAYPIDCVRFFPDCFRALAEYLPCKVIDIREHERLHVFVLLHRIGGQATC